MISSLARSLRACMLGLALLAATAAASDSHDWANRGVSAAVSAETYNVPWPARSAEQPTSAQKQHFVPQKAPSSTLQLGLEALAVGWNTAPHQKLRQDAVRAFGESWVASYEREYDKERAACNKMLEELFTQPEDSTIYDASYRYRKTHQLTSSSRFELWQHAAEHLRENRLARLRQKQAIDAAREAVSQTVLARIAGEATEQQLAPALHQLREALEGVLGEDGQFHFITPSLLPGLSVPLTLEPGGSRWQRYLLQVDEETATRLCEAQPLFAAFKAGTNCHLAEAQEDALYGLLFAAGEYALQQTGEKEMSRWKHRLRELHNQIQTLHLTPEMKNTLHLAHLDYQTALHDKKQALKQERKEKAREIGQALLQGGIYLLLGAAALAALYLIIRSARTWELTQWATAAAVLLLLLDLVWRNGTHFSKGFPVLVQLGLTTHGIWMTYSAARAKRHPLFILMPAIIVLLYQPLFEMKFDNATWAMLDLATIVLLIACAWRRRPRNTIATPAAGSTPAPVSCACQQPQAEPRLQHRAHPDNADTPACPTLAASAPLKPVTPPATKQASAARHATQVRTGWWAIGIGIWITSAFIYVLIQHLAEEIILLWEELFSSWPALLQALAKGAWVAGCFSLARVLWRKKA